MTIAAGFAGHASLLARRAAPDTRRLDSFPTKETRQQWQQLVKDIPASSILVLLLTLMAFALFIQLVNYVLQVIFVLAAVESPKQEPLMDKLEFKCDTFADAEEGTRAEKYHGIDPEGPLLVQQYKTASIRSTIRHLVSVGGKRACWRGLSLSIVYFITFLGLYSALDVFSAFLAGFVPRLVLCTWEMGWVHIVITQQSSKPWYRRIPPFDEFWKICVPTAAAVFAQAIAAIIPTATYLIFLLSSDGRFILSSGKNMFVILVALASQFAISTPAEITLARVQASMLPDSEAPIIDIDKTFGDNPAPKGVGNSGLSFCEAWPSFDSYRRVLKISLKNALIQLAMLVVLVLVLTVESWIFIVPALRRVSN